MHTMPSESTRNGMSSVTTMMTVCGDENPSRAGSGLKTRTSERPRFRDEPEFEHGERGAREVLGRALHEVELGHAVVEVAREPVGRDRQCLAALAARAGGDAVDDGLSGGGNSA